LKKNIVTTKFCRIIFFALFISLFFEATSQERWPIIENHQVLGYQYSFGSSHKVQVHSIDLNLQRHFFNLGYNYQDRFGNKLFAGIGLYTLIQIQYGYGIETKEHILKIRTDYPLILFCDGESFIDEIFNKLSLGFFYEKPFNKKQDFSKFGFSVSLNLYTIYRKIRGKTYFGY
jgi:hypothetical protein